MKTYTKKNSFLELFQNDIFEESLLIHFKRCTDSNEFTWIGTRLNWNLPNGHREFIKLIFKGIDKYQRSFPNFPNNRFLNTTDHFFCKDHEGTYESEMSKVSILKNKEINIKIIMPFLLGNIGFNFKEVELISRIGKGEKIRKNKWKYLDIDTNLPFNFHYPFN